MNPQTREIAYRRVINEPTDTWNCVHLKSYLSCTITLKFQIGYTSSLSLCACRHCDFIYLHKNVKINTCVIWTAQFLHGGSHMTSTIYNGRIQLVILNSFCIVGQTWPTLFIKAKIGWSRMKSMGPKWPKMQGPSVQSNELRGSLSRTVCMSFLIIWLFPIPLSNWVLCPLSTKQQRSLMTNGWPHQAFLQ